MRSLRVLIGMLVLVALLALVLTSCPSNRDGMPGQLATAKEETQSAARSGALALQLWAQHRSTRDLTACSWPMPATKSSRPTRASPP